MDTTPQGSPEPAPPTPAEDDRRRSELRRLAARATAIGIQFAASIVIGFGAGYWIDGKLGTKPWGSLVGLLLGAASAFRDLYLLGRKASKIT